jgi:Zn-dependent peptidase ImmA (M78 family)
MTTTKPIWISEVREREIANLAERMAQRTFSRGRVEPELIAEQEGISFCYASCAEQLDGALMQAGGKFVIFANERRARRGSPRNRFTFAHELGHYFLDDHRRAVIAGKFGARFPSPEFAWDPTFEKEADVFAANLLMPATSFKRSTGQVLDGLKTIRDLARAYGVSCVAAAYRTIELDRFPTPCAVFQWDESGDPVGRKMSPVTFHLSLPYAGTTPRPPPDSVTARAIDRFIRGPRRSVIDGTAWFPNLDRADDFYGVRLREEVMALGEYG